MPMSLVLTPTQVEMAAMQSFLAPELRDCECRLELCGFGPIAAAARTSSLIHEFRPVRVLLIGIAGAFPNGPTVGDAVSFRSVGCYHVGAGEAGDFQTASMLGWRQWEDGKIGDSIDLQPNVGTRNLSPELLTVCAASASRNEALRKALRHPAAAAEDMEGFGVAIACRLAAVDLEIVRGISNVAGDRDKSHWRIDAALHSAATLASESMRSFATGD